MEWDQYRNNPAPVVMKWGFILVTLFMGPLGLLLYVLADKEPRPGEHETLIKPLWKQGVGSTIHCVAGDATGIILAAVITAILGLPMRGCQKADRLRVEQPSRLTPAEVLTLDRDLLGAQNPSSATPIHCCSLRVRRAPICHRMD